MNNQNPHITPNNDGTVTVTLTRAHVRDLLEDTESASLPGLASADTTDSLLIGLKSWYRNA
jgi:hypothetical protein